MFQTTNTMRKSFVLHLDALVILNKMPDDIAGKFIKILYQYNTDGTIPDMDFALEMAVIPFINQFIRDKEKYELVSEKRKESGSKGGKQKVANATNCNQNVANVADNDSVSENDSKSDNVNVKNMPPPEILDSTYLATKYMPVFECGRQYFVNPTYSKAMEILCMQNGLTVVGLKHLAMKFNSHRDLEGKGQATTNEWAKHFRFWVQDPKRKAAENEQKEVKGNGLSAELNKEIFGI